MSRYNKDEICRWCAQGGFSLADVPAEEPAVEREGCQACGKSDVELLDAWVCEECAAEVRTRGYVWEPYAPGPPEPPVEERFAELFRAARVLLEREAAEEQVFLTLAFAGYALGQGIGERFAEKARLVEAWGKPEAWETEVDRFVSRFPGARPVEVVDETLILEQEPVSIEVVPYPRTDVPELVEIHVYPRRERAKTEEIARRYEQKLAAAGIAHDVTDRLLPMSAEPFEGRVIITVFNHRHDVPAADASAVWRDEQPRFQHPEAVRAYCELAIGSPRVGSSGFARALLMRGGKGPASSKWLVPASVALCLREIARIEDNKKIYRLLNEHVYGKERFLGNGSDAGDVNTLWEYTDRQPIRVKRPLYAARHTFERAR